MSAIQNGVMMQCFEWYLENDPHLWVTLAKQARELAKAGFTAVWLPPAYKGNGGNHDVGYGAYDVYDLGEFDQKGSVETKYGTKAEYLKAVKAFQKAQVDVYADIVLNHKMGADEAEMVPAVMVRSDARNEEEKQEMVEAWTKYTFPGRKGKYSAFTWNATHFDGVDYDSKTHQNAIFRLYGKSWDDEVSGENENYDYLMGSDLDFQNPEVIEELDRWGKWYQRMIEMQGVRLDACKHIHFEFFSHWLAQLRQQNPDLFAVGEYWSYDLSELLHYLDVNQNCLCLFDVVLHGHLHDASTSNGSFDMRELLRGTLVEARPQHAVTFVDNHDTQPSQALSSWVLEWFKPHAYSVLLLRQDGYPCIFYGDYYGIPHDAIAPMKPWLDTLLQLRHTHNYGTQHDYFDDCDVVGWTREGDAQHSGLACIMTNALGGTKEMYVGTRYAHQTFVDAMHNSTDEVRIQEDGNGCFKCSDGSVSVYIPKGE